VQNVLREDPTYDDIHFGEIFHQKIHKEHLNNEKTDDSNFFNVNTGTANPSLALT
jgi:hypothetical protein